LYADVEIVSYFFLFFLKIKKNTMARTKKTDIANKKREADKVYQEANDAKAAYDTAKATNDPNKKVLKAAWKKAKTHSNIVVNAYNTALKAYKAAEAAAKEAAKEAKNAAIRSSWSGKAPKKGGSNVGPRTKFVTRKPKSPPKLPSRSKSPPKSPSRSKSPPKSPPKAPLKIRKTLKTQSSHAGRVVSGGVKKARREKPGKVALRNIKKQQKSTDFTIQMAPFARMVRKIVFDDTKIDFKFEKDAFKLLLAAAENHLIYKLQSANMLAINCKRISVMNRDIKLANLMTRRQEASAAGLRVSPAGAGGWIV
jgi:histone H3